MKWKAIVCSILISLVCAVCVPAKTIECGSFADQKLWLIENYENKLHVSVDEEASDGRKLILSSPTGKVDTAWSLSSRRIRIPAGSHGFSLQFSVASSYYVAHFVGAIRYYLAHVMDADPSAKLTSNVIIWYDAHGKQIGSQDLAYAVSSPKLSKKIIRGPVPEGAVECEARYGFDFPDIPPGNWIAFGDFSFAVTECLLEEWFDCDAPTVVLRSASPTKDRFVVVAYEITDASGVDWGSFRIAIDGKDVSDKIVRNGDIVRLEGRSHPWSEGLHKVDIRVEDIHGNLANCNASFLIDEPADDVPRVTLRDDGVTMVDGRPVFPVGVFGVRRQTSNGMNYFRAFEELKGAGVNLVQTYQNTYDPEFIAAAERTEMYLLMSAQEWYVPKFISKGRFNRQVIAWYVGDDTSVHQTPVELYSSSLRVKSIDPFRLTAQADGVSRLGFGKSGYADYVAGTEVFLPELYPVVGSVGDQSDRECVAAVVSDMKQIAKDRAARGNGHVRACWPLLQFFRGYGRWGHFPTRSQIYGMVFAALVYGAHGIVWYDYPTADDHSTEGITSSAERWKLFTQINTMIGKLSPVLLERTEMCSSKPIVVSGPQMDPYGNASVGVMLKRHGADLYAFAVNSSPVPVRARMHVAYESDMATVLLENRHVKLIDGEFEDDFDGFGFNVYRFSEKTKKDAYNEKND